VKPMPNAHRSHSLRTGSPVRSLLALAAVAAAATVVAVSAAGSTYGLWADSAPVDSGIVTTGSLTLAVGSPTVSPTAWNGMFPGDRVRQSATLSNTGSVGADVTARTTSTAPFAADYEVRIAKGACPATPLTTANTLSATPVALGVWAAGETSTVCIEVTLRANATAASQGATAPFTFTFGATQRAN
jgi:hypothetical protein